MYLRVLFIVLFFARFSFTSLAQVKSIAFDARIKKPQSLCIIPDSSGIWAVSVSNHKDLEFFLVNEKGSVIRSKIVNLLESDVSGREVFLGGIQTNEGFHFYFRNEDSFDENNLFSFFLSKKDSGDIQKSSITVKQSKSEVLLKAFAENNVFHCITLDKKQNMLHFLRFSNGKKEPQRNSYRLDPETIKILRTGAFKVFRSGKIPTLRDLASTQKLFISESDAFVLVIENTTVRSGLSEVFVFNLLTNKIDRLVFHAGGIQDVSNSWYSEGKLYKFFKNKSSLQFVVYDIFSQSLIKKHEYKRGDRLTIAASIERDSIESGNEVQILKKEVKLFDRLGGGVAFVQVQPKPDGKLEILAGNYQFGPDAGTMVVTGVAVALIGVAVSGAPVMVSTGGSEYPIISFFSALDNSTLDFTDYASMPDIFKIENFFEGLSDEIALTTLSSFKFNQDIYVAYIIKRENTIKINAVHP